MCIGSGWFYFVYELVKEHQHVPHWLLLFPGIHFLAGLIFIVVGINLFLKTRR